MRCSSGPRNMMMERVRRAASASIAARSSSAGGTISRSTPSLIQRVRTPMEFSTSRRRYTSSMRATRRSTVRPLLSSEAHSSATHAFLLVFTSMAPESRMAAHHTQMHRTGVAEGDDLTVQRLADAGDHLKADVLVAALDPVDRALAGAQSLRELGLCPAAVLPCVTDELTDAYEVVVCHGVEAISDMRWHLFGGSIRVTVG